MITAQPATPSGPPELASAAGRRVECRGSFELVADVDQAFALFTPLGEELWVPGWKPTYVFPADGQLVLDQVFLTGTNEGEESTCWSVIRLEPETREVEYLRITPGSRLGRVSVSAERLDSAGQGEARVRIRVAYVLTALNVEAEPMLASFAEGYEEMLETWQELTSSYLQAA